MMRRRILAATICLSLSICGTALLGCTQESQDIDVSAGVSSSQLLSENAQSSSQASAALNSEANRNVTISAIPEDHRMTATELHDSLEASDPPFVLDVRSAGFYANAFIVGSKNIPAGRQLDLRIEEIPREKKIVIISADDNRVGEAWQTLIDAGFDASQLYVVIDGMDAWVEAGYPTDHRESMGC